MEERPGDPAVMPSLYNWEKLRIYPGQSAVIVTILGIDKISIQTTSKLQSLAQDPFTLILNTNTSDTGMMNKLASNTFLTAVKSTRLNLLLAVTLLLSGWLITAQTNVQAQNNGPKPTLLGAVEKNYKVQSLLHKENFQDINDWVIQKAVPNKTEVQVKNNKLSILAPGGVTSWFRKKLEGPVAIVYQVRAPKAPDHDGVVPRDINNFWHMTTADGEPPLDQEKYTGGFGTYHKLHGYYASTGGRSNTTTRFRRYPRHIDHIALNFRDRKDPYLLTPGKKHTVQLIAADGTAQYVVDGKLVYEISYGDTVNIKGGGKTTYTRDQFPSYTEGWVGLRQTSTHHIYSNFRVYRLQEK